MKRCLFTAKKGNLVNGINTIIGHFDLIRDEFIMVIMNSRQRLAKLTNVDQITKWQINS